MLYKKSKSEEKNQKIVIKSKNDDKVEKYSKIEMI